jgi:BirA family biotin operon repressor/biotin-[acetyl-CoA-carboxylase] ligase
MPEALSPDRLCREQILKMLALECDISLLDSVDSTNEWALRQAKSRRCFPFACFAEKQTQGRGRRGKLWVSPSNSNIYMSLAWNLDIPLGEVGVLSIVIGMAVIRALEKTGVKHAKLKWPNDVLVNNKKIAGILIETVKSNDGNLVAVVGVGLNYNWPRNSSGDVTEEPDQPWTDVVSSLKTEHADDCADDRDYTRDYLAGLLLQECMEMCEIYPHNNEPLLKEYHAKYDVCLHERVDVVLDNGMKLIGIAKGVTAAGEMRVLINEEEHVFNSADISLRKTEAEKAEPGKVEPRNVKLC